MIPPDKERCQADVPGNGPFTLGGKIGNPKNGYRVRCENKPVVIVVEKRPGSDGQRGSMSLCAKCLVALHEQFGDDYADEEPIINIGTKLWRFDQNVRKYTKPKDGGFGKLIWRESWVPMVVVGETRVSWLVGHVPTAGEPRLDTIRATHKLPKALFKAGACPKDWALSEEHLDELVWAEEKRHKLADAVHRCHDPKVLREVDRAFKNTSNI